LIELERPGFLYGSRAFSFLYYELLGEDGPREFQEQSSNGAWEASGISMYSEMDQSLDNCYFVSMHETS
jgi:hypothetical protein